MTLDPARLERALAECAREPIHVIGAIQPPGVLVVFDARDHRIVAASSNAALLFETPTPESLLDQGFDVLVDRATVAAINAVLARADGGLSQYACTTNIGPLGALYDVSVHASGTRVHVEMEPSSMAHEVPGEQSLVASLDAAAAGRDFLGEVARHVQRLAGYDRVMVYRFLPDYCGEVVAEALGGDLASYHGLRYPASDIPPQARALYVRNRVRVIADVDAPPQPVLQSAALAEPLDMSFDVLRAVSPVHLQYLRNMGVRASMSISLVVEGRLWGLVACHHGTPRPVDARRRLALEALGRHVSMILDAGELRDRVREDDTFRSRRDALEARLHDAPDALPALRDTLDHVLGALPADGVAVVVRGEILSRGEAPDTVEDALRWARRHARRGASGTPRGSDWQTDVDVTPCGLFAMPLDCGPDAWLLLFRCEQRDTVRWAGRPDEPFQIDGDGTHIGPRTSFQEWEELVLGSSTPWSERDAELARRVRLVLERYLGGPAARVAKPSASDAPLRQWDAREQATRLRRLAELLDGASPDRTRLRRMHALLAEMEAELGAMAGAVH